MILAILQARTSSSRLPGKVLKPILGEPMLARQLERVKRARLLDKVVVATSVETSDDGIEQLCHEIDQPCFRGSLNNVLERFYQCATQYHPTHVVRLTGDCPLIDPSVIDEVIQTHLDGQYDYTTNAYPFSYPDGLDVEILTMATLQQVYQHASDPDHFEHVTIYVRQHSEQFNIGELVCEKDLSSQRWTVDHAEDFVLAERVFAELYPQDPAFNYQQVMTLFEQKPELFSVNRQYATSS